MSKPVVLIVDDETGVRESVRMVLKDTYDPVLVDTGEAGGPLQAVDTSLVLLAAWAPTVEMSAACPDLSDAAVGPAGNLILLSDDTQLRSHLFGDD